MQIKDLTIDEFRQLIKTCIRETVEEIIDDRLDDDPDTIKPSLRDRPRSARFLFSEFVETISPTYLIPIISERSRYL